MVHVPLSMSPELMSLFDEIHGTSSPSRPGRTTVKPLMPHDPQSCFVPLEPQSVAQSGLKEQIVDGLILRYLMYCEAASGRDVAQQIRLPFTIVGERLQLMRAEKLVAYRQSAGVNDFEYELAPEAEGRAGRIFDQNSYFGSAPVSLEDYAASVAAQSPVHLPPTADELKAALRDLEVDPELFGQLGQALTSAGAMLLYGNPGNGKTSIAERLTAAYDPTIWVPRALLIGREIVRVFDPGLHEELPLQGGWSREPIDQRWVLVKRPTIIVGGELTMEMLEVGQNPTTGTLEAPLQLKSNGGTLVIDEFGRQRVRTAELLNRWAIPLEKRCDYLSTASGKKVQVPFEQLVVFATNLAPEDLVDEAFLRRIPYKIEARDPSTEDLRRLLQKLSPDFGVALDEEIVDYLFSKHYRDANRPLRYCHARDLLKQISNYQRFHGESGVPTKAAIDAAIKNYFWTM